MLTLPPDTPLDWDVDLTLAPTGGERHSSLAMLELTIACESWRWRLGVSWDVAGMKVGSRRETVRGLTCDQSSLQRTDHIVHRMHNWVVGSL